MMTLVRELTQPELISSSSTTTIDPQNTKTARRKRLEINKLKSTCKEQQLQNDVVYNTMMKEAGPTTTCGAHATVSVMGRRREMEDTVTVQRGYRNKYDFFGVYDGHGGSHVAEACKDRMHVILSEEMGETDTWQWEEAFERCFERMDKEVGVGGGRIEEVEEMTVGSTVVVAVVNEDVVVVANCGDSRAVICRAGVAVPLSFDHKPDRPDELARIEAAGGRVINWNGHRVLGVLATSRSIGDHYLKPYVSSTPEITISERTEADEFLILASDGLWDVITNEVACNVVRRCLTGKIRRKSHEVMDEKCKRSTRAEIAAALLVELAIAKGSKDNISIIVVELRRFGRLVCS
ncbi:putative protein phosphatase 2C 8 [Silene latifolia]|uniref:putative protein phosphatase 2C 8 n=1 Tax=Silene latifolia TaxID=37657 RepID=UPI003D786798